MAKKKATTKKRVKQAMRFNKDKPKLSYILDFPNALTAFAEVAEAGAEKYDKHNWKNGLPFSESMDSLLRHSMAVHNCEDLDDETQCAHLAQVMWNAAQMLETLKRHDSVYDNRDYEHEGEDA